LGAGVKAHAHEAPAGMLAGPATLTAISVVLPLGFLTPTAGLLAPAVQAIGGAEAKISLYLFPSEIGLPLVLSMVALLVGAALSRFLPQIVGMASPLPPWLNGDRIYDAAIDGMLAGATGFTRLVQNGKLRIYMMWSVLSLVAVVAPPLVLYGLSGLAVPSLEGVGAFELVAALLIPVAVLAVIRARSRLGAIIAASIVGLMVAFLFVIYSAPDLALTQLLIETLSTVFLVLVFAVLPVGFARLSPAATRVRDGLIAAVVGLTMAGVSFAASSSTALAPISAAFRAESLSEGQGYNVVNVILVDFRGFDTLGEITVLFTALLGIYMMLRLRPETDPERTDRPQTAQPQAISAPHREPNGHEPAPPPPAPIPDEQVVGRGD
ncbi:MAG TPA: DUF4040 domain-containing protein, partial [Chloroflexaceae bacterium]|nr:DUF4040 domain-containing protein [Chloroflexaceae bacterium]